VVPSLRRLSPSVLTQRVMSMVFFQPTRIERFHLPASLRSTGITPLRRYYGCSDSCLRSSRQTGLPAYFVETSDHSASNHPLPPRRTDLVIPSSLPRVTAPSAGRTPPFPGRSVIWASPFPSRLTTATGRIEFALAGVFQPVLRTNRSPPVAPHPASRRRSYVRLQGPNRPWQGLTPC
jgi:hypothetical protein